MNTVKASPTTISRLLFRLLPVQVLMAAVGAVNGIVSSFFASNYVGIDAMSAVGLYAPINTLLVALSTMLVGGAAIISGKYMGQNQQERLQGVFSLDMAVSALLSVVFIVVVVILGAFDLTGFMASEEAVRPLFNAYLLGQAIGIFPFILGSQLPSFLLMENRGKRTMAASLTYIAVNLFLNFILIGVLRMEAFGIALASSLGMWVFFLVQAQYFFSGKSQLRFSFRNIRWSECREIIRTGLPGALTNGYQTIRGFLVNGLILSFVGSAGISAFTAANNLLALFWAIPTGMITVSRLMMSVSVGEEDRQSLTDIMRVMFRRFIPLMSAIAVALMLCAVPLTRIFFRNPAEPVYMMTVWGFRLLPFCMPLAVICTHFVCYGQASGKQVFVHTESLLDGVVCVAAFTALLIPGMGMNAVYVANVLNGIACIVYIFLYACVRKKRIPRTMDDLMVIPENFGAAEENRMNLSVRTIEEVVSVSEEITAFCMGKGIDRRRANLAGLAMEEMAGNIVDHGFTKDNKKHSIDIRVVYTGGGVQTGRGVNTDGDVSNGGDVILRIRDDCRPFNPEERNRITEGQDILKNIGIRMMYRIASDIQYQSLLGLNVLTVRI